MTSKQIEAKAARAQLPYKLALQIRELLDAARAEHKMGAEEWRELEGEVLELVGEEG